MAAGWYAAAVISTRHQAQHLGDSQGDRAQLNFRTVEHTLLARILRLVAMAFGVPAAENSVRAKRRSPVSAQQAEAVRLARAGLPRLTALKTSVILLFQVISRAVRRAAVDASRRALFVAAGYASRRTPAPRPWPRTVPIGSLQALLR